MKKIMKTLTALAAALSLVAAPGFAQPANQEGSVVFFWNYDVASTSYIYAVFAAHPSLNLDPLSQTGVPITAKAVTSGSSTTVTALTASTEPFGLPGAGDMVVYTLPETAVNLRRPAVGVEGANQRVERLIVTNADADTITVDTAIDLGTAGVAGYWKNFLAGTTASSGVFPVSGYRGINVIAVVTTINATSLDFQLQCRPEGPTTTWNEVYTKNFTAAGSTAYALATEWAGYDFCRVGWKVNTDGGAQSVQTRIVFLR